MPRREEPLTPFPPAIGESAWTIMQQWQDFVHGRPDDESATALFILMADMLLSNMAYTHQWTLADTLMYWYRTLVPVIADKVEALWAADDTDTP